MEITKRFELLNIPSKGNYYKNGKPFLYVNLLTAHHEYILSSQMLMEDGNGMDIVVKDVISMNDWINVEDLLWCDYQAIVIFLRANTYGNEVDFSIQCPHCSKTNKINVKLSSLKFKESEHIPLDSGFIEFSIRGMNFKMSQPRRRDMVKSNGRYIYQDLDGQLNIGRNRTGNILSCIQEINEVSDKIKIQNYILNMPKKDFDVLYDFVENNKIGFEKEQETECEFCLQDFSFGFGVDTNFLTLPESYQLGIEEECFLLAHYEGGTSIKEATDMPAIRRKFMIHRLEKELKKKYEKEQAEISKIKSKSKK